MSPDEIKFIVDHNVGKLVKWLRLLGYDTVFFAGADDADMVARALKEKRVMLTRDTGIMERWVVTSGKLKAILIKSEVPEEQIQQVVQTLRLDFKPFTRCLECNQTLTPTGQEAVKGRVPPYVFKTQEQYMECPNCHRIYWRGTHWQAMVKKLARLTQAQLPDSPEIKDEQARNP